MLQIFSRTFRKNIFPEGKEAIHFCFEPGAFFDAESGLYQRGAERCMADFHFYRVNPGDKVENSSDKFVYRIATYGEEIEERLIYTYCYQEDENWAKYRQDLEQNGWQYSSFTVKEKGWLRIVVCRTDEAELTEEDAKEAANVMYLIRSQENYQEKSFFRKEIEETVRKVKEKQELDALTFALISDSHYVINGGWKDSVSNLRAVQKNVGFDAVIHLGDLTDGMVPLSITKEYARIVMEDMKSLKAPFYLTLGNHDSNYFRKNPEWMSQEEQCKYYLQRKLPWYFVDFGRQKLRCLFLYSFDHRETVRYGFPMEEIEWVRDILEDMPQGFSVLVFAHIPLLPEMHYWSSQIRNSTALKEVLDEYVRRGGSILAYVHGHNHADQIVYTEHFPIVAVGCAKCEDFKDKKPEGSVTYDRKMGTVSQELWDVVVVNTKKKKLDFVRFGAGEDRSIS